MPFTRTLACMYIYIVWASVWNVKAWSNILSAECGVVACARACACGECGACLPASYRLLRWLLSSLTGGRMLSMSSVSQSSGNLTCAYRSNACVSVTAQCAPPYTKRGLGAQNSLARFRVHGTKTRDVKRRLMRSTEMLCALDHSSQAINKCILNVATSRTQLNRPHSAQQATLSSTGHTQLNRPHSAQGLHLQNIPHIACSRK